MSVRRIVVFTLLLGFFISRSAAAEDGGFIVKDKIPQQKEPVSCTAAMMLDLFPGGGHFYTGHYYYGAAFGALKIGASGAAWYSFLQWKTAERNFHNAEKTRDAMGLTGSDSFIGSDGKMRSTDSYKKESERRAQIFTFTVIGNLIVYTASWITVWHWCSRTNENALPTFDVGFGNDELFEKAGGNITFCAVKRF